MLASSEERRTVRSLKRPTPDDIEAVLSDPEIRATLRDLMAGLTEAFAKLDAIERKLAARKEADEKPPSRASSTEGSEE